MTRGDIVQLKSPERGRWFRGRILKELNDEYQVGLPNGLYVIRPKSLWQLCDTDNSNATTDILPDEDDDSQTETPEEIAQQNETLHISVLIKDTTREEREKIVKDALALASLDLRHRTEEDTKFLDKYINGEMELDEITNCLIAHYNQSNTLA